MNKDASLCYGQNSRISKLPGQGKTLDIWIAKFICQVGNEGTVAVDRTLNGDKKKSIVIPREVTCPNKRDTENMSADLNTGHG